jgi:hypothetical protein
MSELERIVEAEDKITSFQKKYNSNSKSASSIIGRNLKLFIVILLPLILIGFVWTEFGGILFQVHTIFDVIFTVALFIVAEALMTSIGSDGGKFDADYLSAREELDNVIKEVFKVGTLYLGAFCDWQIDLELVQATRFHVRKLKMTPKMFEEVKEMPYNKLVEKYGKSKAKKIQEIIDLEPIELNEAILLFDGGKLERGGVPESGDEHINDKKHRTKTFLKCFFTGLLAINVLLTFTTDISIARIIYTVFKLVLLLFRMFKGYERGSRAFNRIEVKHLKARTHYLRNYIQFVTDKIYVKLADKYEEIRDLMAENEVEDVQAETA